MMGFHVPQSFTNNALLSTPKAQAAMEAEAWSIHTSGPWHTTDGVQHWPSLQKRLNGIHHITYLQSKSALRHGFLMILVY